MFVSWQIKNRSSSSIARRLAPTMHNVKIIITLIKFIKLNAIFHIYKFPTSIFTNIDRLLIYLNIVLRMNYNDSTYVMSFKSVLITS